MEKKEKKSFPAVSSKEENALFPKNISLNLVCQLQIYSIIPIHHHKNVTFLYKNKKCIISGFQQISCPATSAEQ